MENPEVLSFNNLPIEITPDPSLDPVPEAAPEPVQNTTPEQQSETKEPEPHQGQTVSDNKTEEPKYETIQKEEISQNLIYVPEDSPVIKNNYYYDSSLGSVEVSTNVVIDPDDIVSVNTISMNLISADGLSFNSVSVNVSNNYVSNNTLQIISADSTPFWDKPFKDYTVSEGLLFIIMVTLVFGFVSTHLLRGLRDYGNF